ncbi:MAG: hypothetical protein HY863_14245 [Chloroflexi bacterium]|nr:hypothetical protein [Chloroflexota bacterium]
MARRFRITKIEGPDGQGMLNMYYHFYISYEYDPGEPYKTEQGRGIVRLTDGSAHALADGHIESPNIEPALARISYYVNQKLSEVLVAPTPELNHLFVINNEDVDELLRIDYKRVPQGNDWVSVAGRIKRERKKVFISCGQLSKEEIELGKQIVDLVKSEAGLESYFAEYQNSLEGLTSNIFNALYNSVAFIAIMHRRAEIKPGEFRASVWIEQEVAIAAFLSQSLGVSLPSKAYVQVGVKREGVREFIILNPTEFTNNDEVLEDLRKWLPLIKEIANSQ